MGKKKIMRTFGKKQEGATKENPLVVRLGEVVDLFKGVLISSSLLEGNFSKMAVFRDCEGKKPHSHQHLCIYEYAYPHLTGRNSRRDNKAKRHAK